MDITNIVFSDILNHFNFSYIFSIVILTYIIIKFIDYINKDKKVSTWSKRIVLTISIIFITAVYIFSGYKDYITLLNDKNIKLEQNQFYGAQGKLSRHSSWVMPENDVQIENSQVDFVPTDIIVWQDDGVGYYANLIGIPGNTTVLTTGIDGVSIKLERSVGTVTKVTVINDTDTDLNVKVYRVGK